MFLKVFDLMSVDYKAANRMIEYLNSLLALDEPMVRKIMRHTVKCNEGVIAKTPIQPFLPGEHKQFPNDYAVSVLGLMNGFCGVLDDGPYKGWGPISVIYDIHSKQIVTFGRTEDLRTDAEGSFTFDASYVPVMG